MIEKQTKQIILVAVPVLKSKSRSLASWKSNTSIYETNSRRLGKLNKLLREYGTLPIFYCIFNKIIASTFGLEINVYRLFWHYSSSFDWNFGWQRPTKKLLQIKKNQNNFRMIFRRLSFFNRAKRTRCFLDISINGSSCNSLVTGSHFLSFYLEAS